MKKFRIGHGNKAIAISNQPISQSHPQSPSTFKSKSAQNRISTTTALLLYILYTLSIHLLWTNCVIFTESAQQQLKLNVNPTWNLLQQQHYQRTESNRNLNSNRSHNNLKSNFQTNVSSQFSNSPKLNANANENNNNSDSNSTSNNINSKSIVSSNISSAISIFNNGSANQFDFLTNFPASSVNRELTLKAASLPPSSHRVDVNHRTTTAKEVVSPLSIRTKIGMGMTMRDEHFYVKRPTVIIKTPSPLSMLAHNQHTEYQNPIIRQIFNSYKRNEFRKRISDEIRFKRYQFESENVIKSAKNHAIKRNVNTFTFANLGDNSNVSIINTTTIPFSWTTKPKTIKPSTALSSSASHEWDKLITIRPNFDGKSIFGMEKTTVTDLQTSSVISGSTDFGENQLNQTVNDDRKLNANDSSMVNRMENNVRFIEFGNATTTVTTVTAVTTKETKTTFTTNPITRNFSSGSTPVRFRVNDVFEMDTKQKYYNYSQNINNSSNNNNRGPIRRNKDNQGTSFEGDEQNKWHVQHRNGKRIISLLGLFELSTRNGLRVEGLSELAAAELAVRHINKREHLLPGYTLQLITNDTKVFLFHFRWFLFGLAIYSARVYSASKRDEVRERERKTVRQ